MIQTEKEKWIDDLMGKLDLNQKVGQLMVVGFMGSVARPDTIECIKKYHIGGFRVAQKFPSMMRCHESDIDYNHPQFSSIFGSGDVRMDRIACKPSEYAEVLNQLRDYALDRKDSVPLHFAFDQEGEGTDFLFDHRVFAYPMGIKAANDPHLAYEVGKALAQETTALGANMIHSPVLDVNTNPLNPEIGPRAFSDDPDDVIAYAAEMIRGFNEYKLIATAKHFPGRGDSDKDAHFSLPVIDCDLQTMMDVHLKPYRELIKSGLPAIMAAFTSYPAIGEKDRPAATCREIITDLLRGEFGFKGVVTSDSIAMKGLLDKFEIGDAVIACLQAGCDLILSRAQTPITKYLCDRIYDAVKSGEYPEKQLDESVQRILAMRYDMGLADNGGKVDPSKADESFEDEFIKSTAKKSAEKSVLLMRNHQNMIPIPAEKKVLLVEQVHHFHSFINNRYAYPGILWNSMLQHSDNVAVVLVKEKFDDNDMLAVKKRFERDDFDVIVTTSYYNYRSHAQMVSYMDELKQFGKPIIVVSNTPYAKFGVPNDVDTAVVSFCPTGKEHIEAIADVLYGKITPSASLSVNLG